MSDISFIETADIDNKIEIIIRQTNYTKKEAENKLKLFNYDEISVIKDYIGVKPNNNQDTSSTTLNQQIYKQIRSKLDNSMRLYRESHQK